MKKSILVFLVIILLFIPNFSHAADELTITNWIVESRLLENGSLLISEDISFQFNDKFNGVYRDIVLDGTDGISDINIYELKDGNEVFYEFKGDAKKGDLNVFNYDIEKNIINIAIFSPSNKEEKTFRISYVLQNVATIHRDVGEFYYKFLGRENETPIEYFAATLELPKFNRDDIYIFAHGPLNGEIYFAEDLIKLEVDNVPNNTFIEARVLFPADYIPMSSKTGDKSLNDILDEERALVEGIERRLERKELFKDAFNKVSLVLSGLGALAFGLLFRKFRRSPDIFREMDSLHPKEISPAELNLFMAQAINSRGLMATIFDLASREYISITGTEMERRGRKTVYDYVMVNNNKSITDLLEHERFLIDWLFNSIGNGKEVTTKEIDRERSKNPIAYSKKLNQWIKLVQKELEKKRYFDKDSKAIGVILMIASFMLFTVATISVINEALYGVLLMLLSGILFVYSLILLTRKSDEGYIQHLLWRDFKKEVEKLGNVYIDVPKDKSLIYALALGLNAKTLDSYRRLSGQDYYPLHWGYLYFLYNHRGGSHFEDRFNRSFYGSSGTSSGTSSFGGGGSFTGGGGGGSGGGGAGGF